jgi:hypothetical protein
MRRKLLLTSIGGGVALALFAAGAVAAPGHLAMPQSSAGLVTLAHHGGPGGGGHMSMHSGNPGPRGPMAMQFRSVGRSFARAPSFSREAAFHAHNFHHEHHHHRHFFIAGVPYYDYYYDNGNCWWSRRYHHWVCPSY